MKLSLSAFPNNQTHFNNPSLQDASLEITSTLNTSTLLYYMKIRLGDNAYGKNAINLSKIIRHPDYHEFRQISVNVALEGDFESAHIKGDNTRILPTDTQKNTVYALAKDHFETSIEALESTWPIILWITIHKYHDAKLK